MANGDLIKLGTFYLGGTKRERPTKPWRSDTTPPGAPSVGDIPSFSAGQTIEIRNTDADDAYKIQWREVNDGSKKLLISDRVLLAHVSWDDLNAQGLVAGKTITIDGQQYKLRLLTGGSNYRSGTDAYSGGSPTTNEWDRIIVNEAGFSGLPSPVASDLDTTQDSIDFNSAHNQYWNWFYMYSWAQEVHAGSSALRALRGYDSARCWRSSSATSRPSGIGWRPVLEVLNSAPSVTLTSPANNQVLLAGGTLEVEGTASDADGDSITVIASLNGTALGTVGTGTGTANWQVLIPEPSLQMGDNTLVVTAIDGKGATTSKTLKLTKTDGDVPLLVNDVRYKLPATDDVVAWAKREGNLTVDAALSGVAAGESEWYSPMEKTAAADDEDQFYKDLPVKKDEITLRLTMTRQNVTDDVAITRLIGGIGK